MASRKVVVVTGASAGVGRAAAIAFAREGASVALIARGVEGLAGARREVESAGGRALVLPLDVADAKAVEAAADRVEADFGPIDVWVNAAMVTILAPVDEITPEEYRRVTEVNYLGTVHGTLSALKHMRTRERGVIVQVGSALSYRAIPLQAPYCASKFAVRGFTDSLRTELLSERSGVRLTMVQLAAFNTPQFEWARTRMLQRPQPVAPIFQPEVAGRAIAWVARNPRREMIVGFPALQAIWAQKWLPGIADRILGRRGYGPQLDDAPLPADRPDNLYEPVPRDLGSHGRFDSRSRTYSLQAWATMHRPYVLGAALLVAMLAVVGLSSVTIDAPHEALRSERAAPAAGHIAPADNATIVSGPGVGQSL